MQQLPERFKRQPRSEELDRYITRKYSKHGYAKTKAIEYNPEYKVEHSNDRYRWIDNPQNGLRKVGDAHQIARFNHTGWYVDNFENETVHGEVYQLPARNGEPQYVPAVSDPNNDDAACLDFHSITNNREDAAYWADGMAESWAEREREYQAKEDAKLRIAQIGEEIEETYRDFRRIAKEIRANCDRVQGVGVVRELVKERWQRTKSEIHKLRAEREKIENEGLSYY